MRKNNISAIFPFLGMVILILDTKTALCGAAAGIALSLQTVIPSLFPFLVLSTMATSALGNKTAAFLRPLGRLLRIPKGSEVLFLIGLLGGYPTGANVVASAYRERRLSANTSRRMLAFCSNAGPAFIFGFGADLFSDRKLCWYLWGIHILAALIVGILTTGSEDEAFLPTESRARSLTESVFTAAKSMGIVCSWVVIFRVILSFCQRWLLWMLPTWASVLLQGLVELANGSVALYQIPEESIRFVLFCLMLGFGGCCVAMQTFALCGGLDTGCYLPGKVMQALISVSLSAMLVSRDTGILFFFAVALLLLCGVYYFLSKQQKKAGFPVRSALQ